MKVNKNQGNIIDDNKLKTEEQSSSEIEIPGLHTKIEDPFLKLMKLRKQLRDMEENQDY